MRVTRSNRSAFASLGPGMVTVSSAPHPRYQCGRLLNLLQPSMHRCPLRRFSMVVAFLITSGVYSVGCGVWSRRTRVRGRGCYCTDTRRKKTAHICDLVCALELNHERSAPPHSTLRASLRLNTQLSSSLAAKRFFRSRSFFFSPSTSAILLPVQRGEKSLSETSHGCACACNIMGRT